MNRISLAALMAFVSGGALARSRQVLNHPPRIGDNAPVPYPATIRPSVAVKPKKSAMTHADHERVQAAMAKRQRKNDKRARER